MMTETTPAARLLEYVEHASTDTEGRRHWVHSAYEVAEQMAETEAPTAYALARLAECGDPAHSASEGADFLTGIRTAVAESLAYQLAENPGSDLDDLDDTLHEIADTAVPIYTHQMWATFADLAAWQEDPSEIGADVSDMAQAASACLYLIGRRLAYTLAELLLDAYTEARDDAENDEA